MMKPKGDLKKKFNFNNKKLHCWKEVTTKTILPRTFSDVQCCVLNSNTVYIFQRQIDMNVTNTFAIYHLGILNTQ